ADEIRVAPGFSRLESSLTRPLLAHELAHVAQRQRDGTIASPSTLEAEAQQAAPAALQAMTTTVTSRAARDRVLHSTLSDALNLDWTAHHSKGRIFDLLRANSSLG